MPEMYLARFTQLSVTGVTKSIHDRLAWVIRFDGISFTDPGTRTDNKGCTHSYVVDAGTGAALLDEMSCPPGK